MLRKVRYTVAFWTFLIGILAPLGFAAPRLKIEPPAKRISTDQSVTLKILLEWPQEEGPYEVTSLEPRLENLILEDQNQSQESGPIVSQVLLYKFRPITAGTAVIYPFEVSYRNAETEPWTPILVPEQNIKIVSNTPWKIALFALFISLGLGVVGFAGYALWKFFETRSIPRNIPPLDPKQRLYAKAEESVATFASSNPKEKLTHWSNQLRAVVVSYYSVPQKIATNTELLSFLKAQGLPAGEWNEISRLFGQLTEMQFSQQDIPAYELDRMQKSLLQYIKGKIIIGNSNS